MTPRLAPPTCPCGSGAPFERCCSPFLAGAPAPTAETLMRSRYTAYVRGAIEYIVETHDPATRRDVDRNAAAGWSREADWLNLSIVSVEAGGPADDEGTVEFVARYRVDGQTKTHRERSRFRKIAGLWYYSGGRIKQEAPARKGPEVGRNDPCPCGSGKKSKRCCGA